MQTLRMIMIVAITLIISGSGCGDIRYVSHRLPLDARPDLPVITEAEARQIPKAIWLKIETRDRERRQYCEGLETTIITNNKQAEEK